MPGKFAGTETWAKCDMLATVCLKRLDRIKIKDSNNKRIYVSHSLIPEDLEAIIRCMLTALGLSHLTMHL